MDQFAALVETLDQTTRTTVKVAALADYFSVAPENDRLWTIALLSGRRPRRVIATPRLRDWAAEAAGVPPWLFEESYAVVGDLAETIALLLPPATGTRDATLSEWVADMIALSGADDTAKRAAVRAAWDTLPTRQRFVYNKLITGGFRLGVSRTLMTRALARATGLDSSVLAHRLMGDWTPRTTTYGDLVLSAATANDPGKPYPFALAHPLDDPPDTLGAPDDWLIEWKWDGIRAQLLRRTGTLHVWSRGEDLMTDRFPDLAACVDFLPDGTVIDGEILAWDHARDRPQPFSALQRRLGRKTVSRKLLAEVPVVLCAYDLIEWQGKDWRTRPMADRRAQLDALLAPLPCDLPVRLSPRVVASDWPAISALRDTARDRLAEGFMLKRASSPYHTGRKKGGWWKWKVDPLSIDAVMIYAQAGHGRRANLFTDFTFAVWDGDALVPFTKAYSGLTDAEFRQITAWVRKNTLERFGPVRRVPPHHVFEIHFEGIQRSTRHKSGVALRFPRMARWRRDKPVAEANTRADLDAMLDAYG